MKECLLFILFLLTTVSLFSQEKTSYIHTNSNGVKVHKSNGVEGKTNKQSGALKNEQIPISEYNITQCENAIQDINDKINHLIGEVGTEERILKYRNSIIILENRLNEIKLNK